MSSSTTPKVNRSEAVTDARTPTVAPLISVPSSDIVTLHQQTFQSICQQYVDEDGWTTEQQRVLGEIFNKFAHNVFATVRKNITTSSAASKNSTGLTEPLDRKLVEDVESMDSELDELSSRVAALREEVPQLMEKLVQQQKEMPSSASPSTGDDAAAVLPGAAAVGSVISHVAKEIQALAEEFEGVKTDIDTAVTDCSSTLDVVKSTLAKPESSTQKAIFVASDISNAHKRKISSVGDKSASPQKSARTTVSKENE
eukprot:INCI3750.1.p1 GENE.INCI3750.1~~INCI3750.1.p1  ORF type:complete len:256 (-),score=60.26 INCI3750.1:1007-1774(-)